MVRKIIRTSNKSKGEREVRRREDGRDKRNDKDGKQRVEGERSK